MNFSINMRNITALEQLTKDKTRSPGEIAGIEDDIVAFKLMVFDHMKRRLDAAEEVINAYVGPASPEEFNKTLQNYYKLIEGE